MKFMLMLAVALAAATLGWGPKAADAANWCCETDGIKLPPVATVAPDTSIKGW